MNYEIKGDTVPYVECTLSKGKSVYTQSGGMAWRDPEIEMATSTKGGVLKGLGRMVSGDSIFMNTYTALKDNANITFAATVPGEIIKLNLTKDHPGVIAQKGAFLFAEEGVKLDIAFTKKIKAGLFGGEGFVLQNISGEGLAFLEVDGNICKNELKEGETILIDTGNIVCFDKSCTYTIETVKGVKNVVFGGEGLFLTKITGPGVVVLQSQSLNEFATRLLPYIPRSN